MAEYIDRTLLELDTEWSEYEDGFISYSQSQINSLPTADLIPIPDRATNGDIIKAMFPYIESRLDEKTGIMLVKWTDGTTKTFKADWWNAPYKKEVEE